MVNINTWIGENHDRLNLSPELLHEIMNNITHGNFDRAVNGEALDMSFFEQGCGGENGNTAGEETGFVGGDTSSWNGLGFPQSEAPVQTVDLASLYPKNEPQITIYRPGAQSNQPTQAVSGVQNVEQILLSSADNKVEGLKKYFKSVGAMAFVKDVFNSEIASKHPVAFQMAENAFKLLGDAKTIAYKGIHNTTNAIMLAADMSFSDICKIGIGQNVYVTEELKKIKEKKEKKQG